MSKCKTKKREMFREDLKRRYIEYALAESESESPDLYERGIINRFARAQEFEEEQGKDICEMSRDEAIAFLQKFLCGGVLYQQNTISTLRGYVEWAMVNKLTSVSENSFAGLDATDIDVADAYADIMVKDEDDLVESLSVVLNGIDEGTSDNAKWCIFLLLFAGLDFKDIFYVKKDDVDLNGRTIRYDTQTIVISQALADVLHVYFSMDKLQKNGKGDSGYGTPIIDEGYLISNSRAYGTDRDKMRATYTSDFSMLMKESAKKLKPSSINDSGVFYRMHLKEIQTSEIDCTEYLMARKYQNSVINSPDRVKQLCQHEYETWKRAFNL